MSPRKVSMALTEEAIQLLSATYADFGQAGLRRRWGRINYSGPLGSYDFGQVRLGSAYLRLISTVEAYVDSLCSDLLRKPVAYRDSMFRALVSAAELHASVSWNERKSAFSQYHGLSLGTCEKWSEVDAGTNVRNAIAHGLGLLTPRQRNEKVRKKIRSVGVDVVDDRIILNCDALKRCYNYCGIFVRSIDSKIST